MGVEGPVWHARSPGLDGGGHGTIAGFCSGGQRGLPWFRFCSHQTHHPLPRPLLAFLLCQVQHSHVGRTTTHSIKLDRIMVA